MADITKLVTSYLEDDLSGLVCSEPMFHGLNYKKVNVYNKSIDAPLHKIWLRTPKMKIFKPTFNLLGEGKNIPLSILLSPNVGNIKKFRLFIRKLEKKISSLIKLTVDQDNEYKNHKIKSSIRTNNNFNDNFVAKMPCEKVDDCHEFLFHIYNNQNKRVSIKSLDSGTYVSTFIELSEVWISDSEFGFNWKVLQMKLYPEFDFSQCLFDDEEVEDEKEKQSIEECYHCMYCPNKHVRTHYCASPWAHMHQQALHGPPIPQTPYQQKYPTPYQSHAPPPPPSMPKAAKKSNNNQAAFRPAISISMKDLLSVKLKPVNRGENPTKKKNDDKDNEDEKKDDDLGLLDIKKNLKTKDNKQTKVTLKMVPFFGRFELFDGYLK